jgi:hypothetical protein
MIGNNLSTTIEKFKAFMAEKRHFPPEVLPDGQIHRYNTNGKRENPTGVNRQGFPYGDAS